MARLPNVALAAIGLGDLVVEQLRPPAGAATDRWGVGVGEFAANLPRLPGLLRGFARQLNRFGSVVISPVGIGFDGDEVDWSRVPACSPCGFPPRCGPRAWCATRR